MLVRQVYNASSELLCSTNVRIGSGLLGKQSLRAKRWNERLRLSITFLNVTSIGVFGLAVTAPWLRSIGKADGGPAIVLVDAGQGSLISWEAAGLALLLHLIAHILVGLTVEED